MCLLVFYQVVGGTNYDCFNACADEASTNLTTNEAPDSSVQKAEIGENSRMLSQAEKHADGTKNGIFFTFPDLFGGKFAKIFGAMRSQVSLPHLLVITVAVVLLLQVCTSKVYVWNPFSVCTNLLDLHLFTVSKYFRLDVSYGHALTSQTRPLYVLILLE